MLLFRRLAGLIFRGTSNSCIPSFSFAAATTTTTAAAFVCWATTTTTTTTTTSRLHAAAAATQGQGQGKQSDKMNESHEINNNNKFRILLHGGDNMLGRAVQLTFPVQSPGEELIKDSCTATHYRDMALGHPSSSSSSSSSSSGRMSMPNLDEICRQNLHGHGAYLWGDSLLLGLARRPPNVRMLNLETAVTRTINNKDVPLWKGIRYHTHVDNIPTIMQGLVQATYKIQNDKSSSDNDNEICKDNKCDGSSSPLIVSYANNHCMDYGRRAFEEETLPCLKQCNRDGLFQTVGCGDNLQEAAMPAITNDGKFQVFAFSTGCSGTPPGWWATSNQSGLVGLPALIDHESATKALEMIKAVLNAHDGDSHTTSTRPSSSSSSNNGSGKRIRVISIHWGPNWALDGESKQQLAARRELAHSLINECQVDMIYGHSSHHIRGMEVYNSKLIVYGAGDIVNDYEGFENPGEERYNKLGGVFVIDLDAHTGDFIRLWIVPMFMNRLHLERYQFESELWDPWTRTMHRVPDKSRNLARFVNKLSVADAGSTDRALMVEHVDEDSEIPGGPVLRSVAPS